MKKVTIISLLLSALLWSNLGIAIESGLVGSWKNESVSLTLKKDGTYHYRLNALVQFSGKWIASKTSIQLHYSLLGFKKMKKVNYRLEDNQLIIKKEDRPEVILKK